jgi:hypothetical protein
LLVLLLLRLKFIQLLLLRILPVQRKDEKYRYKDDQ